ncbi:MAG: ATP-binding protein [Archangium sp.]
MSHRDEGTLTGEAFRQLAESAPDALAVHHNGFIVWANAASSELLAVPLPQLIGRTVFEFVDPAQQEAVRTAMAGHARSTYVTHLLAGGKRIEVEVTRIPIADDLVLVVARNLERERQQRVAEARARAFFDASTAALGISKSGVHVEANVAYARLFGFEDPAQLVGMPILDLIDPSEHERIRTYVRERAAGARVHDTYDVLARKRDGSTFQMHVQASAYPDGSETVTMVVVSDVSAERAAAGERAHRERLESIGRLAGGVAHDFNNLLGAILANVDLSLHELPSGALQEQLTTIREATQRAKALVRQILTFGRRDQPRPVPIDALLVISEALTLTRSGFPSGVTLTTALTPVEGSVLADPTQLHQIVINLVSNARDAVGVQGMVDVSTVALDGSLLSPPMPGKWLRFRVRDDGVGMSAETRRHLFEPYHTTKAGRGGHGLGLAVVQGIVTSLSGRIEVDSAPGKGATFDVLLPLTSAPRSVRFTPPMTQVKTGRVLVVDDEPILLRSLVKVLRSLGYEVLEAANGQAALEVLKKERVDVLLSDVTMPGMSGVELAREVALAHPAVRILLSSGYSDGLDTLPPGVKAVLPKPAGRKELALALTAVLLEAQ